jgi:small-conductance mechanosensitive channel
VNLSTILLEIQTRLQSIPASLLEWVSSLTFYVQAGFIVGGLFIAYAIRRFVVLRIPAIRRAASEGEASPLRTALRHFTALSQPILVFVLLGIAADISTQVVDQGGLVRAAQGFAGLYLLHLVIARFVKQTIIRAVIRWTAIPVGMLYVLGWLAPTVDYLDGIKVTLGNIEFSVSSLIRVLVFGALLFWFGRISNNAGQKLIRNQSELDIGTREIFAKMFEVIVYMAIFILLLQVMGINLTTLAVFGGALGVFLGFGLQAIASNFISGVILLLDRSLKVGDYIELEDGRTGTILSMNMRSTTLETFTGKVVVVPNETFITGTFTNWTHNNDKQRYSIEFQVSYDTDLERLFELLREVVASHPQVISGEDATVEERPDAEIAGFGDSGVDVLVEYWMTGIDDGRNRVGADLYLMIWKALHEHKIEIPFPQREVKILNGTPAQ